MSSNPTESAPPAATPEPVDENKLIIRPPSEKLP